MRLALLLLLCGCADARDLFRPYAPVDAEVRDVLENPWPAEVLDAAIILGCPTEPDGSISDCQRCRVKTAVRQFKKGHVRHLIFSGGAAHTGTVEADVMGELAIARGVPPDRVLRERRALTTWQNLRFSMEILRGSGWRTALVISTADHLPRARRIARFYGLDAMHTAYLACDLDLPPDSEEEWQRR